MLVKRKDTAHAKEATGLLGGEDASRGGKRKRKKKEKELTNFYRFQLRENKRQRTLCI